MIKGIQVRKINIQQLVEIFQTAGTIDERGSPHLDLNKQALWCAGYPNNSGQIFKEQVILKFDLGDVKIEIAAEAYCLMDNKANIQPQ